MDTLFTLPDNGHPIPSWKHLSKSTGSVQEGRANSHSSDGRGPTTTVTPPSGECSKEFKGDMDHGILCLLECSVEQWCWGVVQSHQRSCHYHSGYFSSRDRGSFQDAPHKCMDFSQLLLWDSDCHFHQVDGEPQKLQLLAGFQDGLGMVYYKTEHFQQCHHDLC